MTTFITKGTMSSEKDDWGTPRLLFSILDGIFHFTLDPCSSDGNNLCEKHYTREDSGLEHSWQGETVFMNPPYGKDIGLWTGKALAESRRGGVSGRGSRTCENGHEVVARLHPGQGGRHLHQGTSQVRRRRPGGSVPFGPGVLVRAVDAYGR